MGVDRAEDEKIAANRDLIVEDLLLRVGLAGQNEDRADGEFLAAAGSAVFGAVVSQS